MTVAVIVCRAVLVDLERDAVVGRSRDRQTSMLAAWLRRFQVSRWPRATASAEAI